MLDRRAFLLASAAGGATLACPSLLAATPQGRSPALAKLLDQFFQEGLVLRPEGATQLGLDKGDNAGLRSKLDDPSDAGRAAAKAQTQSQLQRLAAIDRTSLSPADRLDYDVVL